MIPATISQIPHRYLDRKSTIFEISPSVVEIVQKHTDLTTDPDWIRSLLQIASEWYVGHGHISHARALSNEIGNPRHLLTEIREASRPLAEQEKWKEIAISLQGIPHKEILKDSDLSFWYFLGLSESNQWNEIRTWNQLLLNEWATAEDRITTARYHLVRSWISYIFQRGDQALEHAEIAYRAFGETASIERMWASGAASVAEGLRGNAAGSREWSALTNLDQSLHLRPSKLSNGGFIPERYSWLAVRGLLRQTLSIVDRHIRSLHDFETMTIRYHELAAQIHIEQGNLDSARSHIEQMRKYGEASINGLHYLRMVESKLAWAEGDSARAFATLDSEYSTLDLRFDRMARENYQRASIAADFGDLSTAELYLSVAPLGETPNIRFFGDAHPELVQAKILWKHGDLDQAIQLAQKVAEKAEAANQAQVGIAANAIIAFIFDEAKDTVPRDRAIKKAIQLNGDSGFDASFRVGQRDVRELLKQEDTAAHDEGVNGVSASRLTEREIELLRLVHQGKTNQEIADHAYISLSTVKNHLSSAFDKLNSRNRREAVRQALRLGVLSDDE